MKHLLFIFSILSLVISVFTQTSGTLIFQEDFNTLDRSRWMHLITAWRGGNNEFQYYTNRTENRLIAIYFIQLKFIENYQQKIISFTVM